MKAPEAPVLLRRPPAWAPPALLALVLGLIEVGRPDLWRDELASWTAATRSLGQLWGLLGHVDAVSGAYYVLLHFWINSFGTSAAALRMPSVLATAVSAGLTAVIGKRLFSARVGLWAGLLYALTPLVIRYAQEARVYAMVDTVVLLATLQLLTILDCRENPGRRRMALRWLGYAALMALAGLLHLVALSVLTGHLWLVYTRRRRAWRGFVPAAVLAFAVLTPLLLAGHDQAGRQLNWTTRPNIFALPGLLGSITASWPVTVVLLALTVVACLRRPGRLLLPLPILPVLTVWLVSQGSTSYWVERYLLFVVPFWAIIAAAGAERLPFSRWTAPAAVLLVALIALPYQVQLRQPAAHTTTDWKGAASIIATGYREGDAFVPERGPYAKYMLDLGIEYYLPSADRPRDLFAAKTPAQADDLMAVECTVPATCLHNAPRRIWVVSYGYWHSPMSGLTPAERAALAARYNVTSVHHVQGLTIGLLTLKR
ncbi:mannosyltransferase [Streptacidiphilus sp. BW17]|uniref:glycosyltransferase family 39 protein n=1 Tax=Streptacidiphilus sp. BW17 TaxID=3156274 RepID=UPI003513637B